VTIKISVEDNGFTEFLRSRMPTVQAAIARALYGQMLNLQRHIVGDKLSGQVLHHRTGKLIDSIRLDPPQPVVEPDQITAGVVGGGSLAPYGIIHEYGTDSSYEIVPTVKKALAFMVDGQQVIVRRVTHPPFPERSFMRSSFDDLRQTIIDGVQGSVNEVLSK
jgi:hypothetical protein